MPYRGKPSRGCALCRQRKVRCDQRLPGCLNCEKLGRNCPGYRDQTELMFLDETADVTDKARRSSATSRTGRSTPETEKHGQRQSRPSAPKSASSRSISPDIDAQATAFFFDNFAMDGQQSAQSSFFSEASSSDAAGARALLHSIKALGLAGLSRHTEAPHLMRNAETEYLNAIRSMNAALGTPEEAKKDTTLLAVFILTVFETVVVTESHTLTAWSNHVQGAAALLDARGPQQFASPTGFRLFIQASLPICANCIAQGIRLPEPMLRLLADAKTAVGPFDPVMKLCEHKFFFADFFGQVKSHELTDFEVIVRRAQELDEIAASTLQDMETPWAYRVLESEEGKTDQFLLGYYHLYSYYIGAEMWNGSRAIRLLLNQMIRSILLLGFTSRPPIFTQPEHTLLFQRATANMYTLQDEVIASVPQYMGWVTGGDNDQQPSPKGKQPATTTTTTTTSSSRAPSPPPPLSRASSTSQNTPTRFLWSNFSTAISTLMSSPASDSLPLIRSNGAGNLSWVLFLLGAIDITTDEMRNWSMARLKEIGETMGSRQATVLAGRLERGDVNEAWYRNPWGAEGSVVGSGVAAEDLMQRD